MKWKVGGQNKVRGKFEPINDTVEADMDKAMKEARKKYPRAPELSVLQLGKDENGNSKSS